MKLSRQLEILESHSQFLTSLQTKVFAGQLAIQEVATYISESQAAVDKRLDFKEILASERPIDSYEKNRRLLKEVAEQDLAKVEQEIQR